MAINAYAARESSHHNEYPTLKAYKDVFYWHVHTVPVVDDVGEAVE